MTAQNRTPRVWLKAAAELWWQNPSVTQSEIAKQVGLSREAVNRAMQTEEWEVTLRELILTRMPELVPAAWKALKDQWARGNAQGAVDVLRAFGYLANERVNLEHSGSVIQIRLVGKGDSAVASPIKGHAVAGSGNGNGGGHR